MDSPPRKRSRKIVIDPEHSQAFALSMLNAGVRKETVDKMLARIEPLTTEISLAILMRRAGVSTDVMMDILRRYRIKTMPVLLTVVGQEEVEEEEMDPEFVAVFGDDPDFGQYTAEEDLPEIGMSGEEFWIDLNTTVKTAVKDAIQTSEEQYFQYSFSRDDDATQVYAKWKDDKSSDYGVLIYDSSVASSKESGIGDIFYGETTTSSEGFGEAGQGNPYVFPKHTKLVDVLAPRPQKVEEEEEEVVVIS